MTADRQTIPARISSRAESYRRDMVQLLRRLVELETPSTDPAASGAGLELLRMEFEDIGLDVEINLTGETGGWLAARSRPSGMHPSQLLVGHIDTVWPKGTLATMPFGSDDAIISGPGSFDMKAGLAQIVFSLKIVKDIGLEPDLDVVVFVNSDEEIGSPETTDALKELARRSRRAYILEPALGPDGALKTSRKGGFRYEVEIRGRAAHAGLDPAAGSSAIVILAEVVQALFALNDSERGITVNVGMIEGGTRPNVVPESARAVVEVRAPTMKDADRIDRQLKEIAIPESRGSVTIRRTKGRPPMEPSPGGRRLWNQARAAASELGFELREAAAGGASDGNTTSQFCPTLDGLGGVGDGAHAAHEHIRTDQLVERTALLALLVLAPDVSELRAKASE